MTTAEFLASGQYMDFLSIAGIAHPLPLGYTIEPSPVETANVKTMASGRKRKDLIRIAYKFKLSWAVATQAALDALTTIYTDSQAADTVALYLRKERPTGPADFVVHSCDLVNPIKYKPRTRVTGLHIYESVSLELE